MKLLARIFTDGRITGEHMQEQPGGLPAGFEEVTAFLNAACAALDLSRPVLLTKHVNDFNSFGRAVFKPDDFMEPVSFSRFELELLREKKEKSAGNPSHA